jgi:hypothetical protein
MTTRKNNKKNKKSNKFRKTKKRQRGGVSEDQKDRDETIIRLSSFNDEDVRKVIGNLYEFPRKKLGGKRKTIKSKKSRRRTRKRTRKH